MSGGSFNYAYSRTAQFAEELRERLAQRGQPRGRDEYEPDFEPDVVRELYAIASDAERTAALMRAAEWLYSGDYGEESFLAAVQKARKT